jgi:hypothetical protein
VARPPGKPAERPAETDLSRVDPCFPRGGQVEAERRKEETGEVSQGGVVTFPVVGGLGEGEQSVGPRPGGYDPFRVHREWRGAEGHQAKSAVKDQAGNGFGRFPAWSGRWETGEMAGTGEEAPSGG